MTDTKPVYKCWHASFALDARREYLEKLVNNTVVELNETLHKIMVARSEIKDSYSITQDVVLYSWAVTDFKAQACEPFKKSGWVVNISHCEKYPDNQKLQNASTVYTITLNLKLPFNGTSKLGPYR